MMKQQEEIQQVYDKYGTSMISRMPSVTDSDAAVVCFVPGYL